MKSFNVVCVCGVASCPDLIEDPNCARAQDRDCKRHRLEVWNQGSCEVAKLVVAIVGCTCTQHPASELVFLQMNVYCILQQTLKS